MINHGTKTTSAEEPPGDPMDRPQPGTLACEMPPDPADRYRVGTLQYTKLGLVLLFFWLLWGDFTFTLMENMVAPLLQLKLKSLDASNRMLFFINSTIPYTMNFLVVPVVSFRSDRFRSRFGRRIPFLFLATPPVTLALIAMGFSPEIGRWVHPHLLKYAGGLSMSTVIIGTIAVLMVVFQFFNMFIASVYYYLFNDVVPQAYLARFMAWFRMVAIAASMLYNYFIFQYAQTHMRAIFCTIALMYCVGFMMMCWRVREGQYPPPPPLEGSRRGVIASIKTYFRECFTHPFYLCFFAMGTCAQLAMVCSNGVGSLFYLHLGITLDQLGKLNAYVALPTLLLLYPAGWLAERYHAFRILFILMLLGPIGPILCFFLIHDYRSVVILTAVGFPSYVLYLATIAPAMMLLLPKDRYGQFASADAMCKAVGMIVMSFVGGLFMDLMKWGYNGNEEYYRWMYIWMAVFNLAAAFFAWRTYRYWKQYGGPKNYQPPMAGTGYAV